MIIKSFPGSRNLAVLAEVSPTISYYLQMELIENPIVQGGDMLIPPPGQVLEPNYTVRRDGRFYYQLVENAREGTFMFRLGTYEEPTLLDYTTAHISNDYLYFNCSGYPQCSGTLQIIYPFGQTSHPINALSGDGNEHPVPAR